MPILLERAAGPALVLPTSVRLESARARYAFGAFVGLCLAYHFVMMDCYLLHRIPRGNYLLRF